LIYDINKGTHSVGSHVRDAACYVALEFCSGISSSYYETLCSHFINSANCGVYFLIEKLIVVVQHRLRFKNVLVVKETSLME
jgi:hypothetical protein